MPVKAYSNQYSDFHFSYSVIEALFGTTVINNSRERIRNQRPMPDLEAFACIKTLKVLTNQLPHTRGLSLVLKIELK